MENISSHISYEEATFSQTAIRNEIKNHPSSATLERMKKVAEKCFEPLRNHFSVPIKISSFYRCDELNKKIGGAKGSQHTLGEAIDIQAKPGGILTNRMIFDWLKDNVEFDQLINEYPNASGEPSWVHVSYREGRNRKQVLTIR